MKNDVEKYTYRQFLNRPGFESSAMIYADASRHEWRGNVTLGGQLKITDCSRSINLSLVGDNQAEVDNTIFKLRRIEKVARELRQLYEASRDDVAPEE